MRKKAGVTILISDKIDFQRRAIKRDPEGHFITLKGRIHQEDINIVNIYAPNMGTPKYIRKILEDSKKDIDSNFKYLTSHLQELEEQQQTKPRASRRKEITKIREDLNDIET